MKIRSLSTAILLFAVSASQAANLTYNADTGLLDLNAEGATFTTFELKSASGGLMGAKGDFAHLGGSFDVYNADKAFKLEPDGFGDIAGYARIAADLGPDCADGLSVSGSLAGGGGIGDVAIICPAGPPMTGPHDMQTGDPLLNPSNAIYGGQSDGTTFVIGTDGTAGGVNNWPGGEPPSAAIDGAGQKYLNFAEFNTGFVVTPGTTTVNGIKLWAANDAEPRDPTGYEVWGTNEDVSGGDLALSLFSPISTGDFTLPETRNPGGAAPLQEDTSVSIVFDNDATYSSYLVLFPGVKDEANANSMQIAEVQLYGQVPEPTSITLLGLGALALGMVRRRRS